jgi:hypothetical protein
VKHVILKVLGYVLFAGIVFGLFVVAVIPFEMYKKSQAESWPSRTGVITKSFTSRQRGSGGRGGNAPYVRPEICGNYRDNGEEFCVTRVRYGGFRFGEGRETAEETVARYPVGREVVIHYSPDDPKETVLEASSPWTEMFALLGLAIAFLLLPVILWLFRKRIEPGRYV